MINEKLKIAIDSLMAYDKVTLKPFKDITAFDADISPWEVRSLSNEEESQSYADNNSILGHLGYLIPPDEDIIAEDNLIEYLNEIIDDLPSVNIANVAILLSRVDWIGRQDRDNEVLSNSGKKDAAKAVNILLEAYNLLPWPERYKTSRRDNYRVKDWELMFLYFDYLPDFHNPMLPMLNLMEQAGDTPDTVEMPRVMNKVALGFFYETWARYYRAKPFYRTEQTLIAALEDERLPPSLCTAYILGKATAFIDKLPKTIHWLMNHAWEDSGRTIMKYTYSGKLPEESKIILSKLIDSDMESRYGSNSQDHAETFKSFEWPYDYAALAGWVVDFETGDSKDFSDGAINEIASQWKVIREDLRVNIKHEILTSQGGRHRWFLDPVELNSQKAMVMITHALINCGENIWGKILRGLKKDIALARSLLITSTAQFYGLHIFEEWILILLYSILNAEKDSADRIWDLTNNITNSLLPYILKAESEPDIWDYEGRRPLLSKNLYLIIELVKKLPSNQYADKLKSEWEECASIPWPWMVEEVV